MARHADPPEVLTRMRFSRAPMRAGQIALDCVAEEFLSRDGKRLQIVGSSGGQAPETSRICFSSATVVLRTITDSSSITTFNDLGLFEGQYVARSIHIAQSGGAKLDIQLDVFESLGSTELPDLAPPADAVLVPDAQKVTVAPGVMDVYRTKGDPPQYPAIARAARIQGTVALQALIRSDGTIGDLQVISGAPMLQSAAQQGVQSWRYKPYLVGDEPVDVDTQIYVTFELRD
jgi:TonB family protein